MSAVTVVSAGTSDRRPAHPTRALARAVLRPHQSALWFWGLLVALIGGGLLWAAGPGFDAVWDAYLKSGCRETDYCAMGPAYQRYDMVVTLGPAVLTVAPALIGAWAGASLIGRELESGTAELAWTQSVTPARWLAAKLAVPAALLTAGTGLLVPVNIWARGDGDPDLAGDWYYPDVFVSTGPVAVAYALAGLALGALAGLVWRRAMPAAGVALAASLLLHSLLERHREDLWPSVTRTEAGSFELPRSALQVAWSDSPRHGVPITRATFHPESHFWPLQYVETGLLLAVAATATAAAFVLLARRLP